MFPHRAQCSLFRKECSRLSPAEYVPSLVKHRTLTTAAGDEADIVIIDLVRTKALGHSAELRILNTLDTGARLITVVIADAALSMASSRKEDTKEHQSRFRPTTLSANPSLQLPLSTARTGVSYANSVTLLTMVVLGLPCGVGNVEPLS